MEHARLVADAESYGEADDAGRETLGKLDAGLQGLRRLQELLEVVREGRAGKMLGELLRRRLRELRAEAERVAAEATLLLQGMKPTE